MPTKPFFTRLLLCSILLFWAACQSGGPAQETEENIEAEAPQALENEVSEFFLPISYDMKKLDALVNSKIKKVLYHDDSFKNNGKDNLKIKVTRAGKVYIAARGNTLYYNLPVSIECSIKKKLLPQFNTDFSLRIKGKSDLMVDNAWKLNSKSKFIAIEWIKKPKIKVGFAKVNIAKVVEKLIKEKSGELFQSLDKAVHEKVELRSQVEKIWKSLQKPIQVNKKEKDVWLTFNPQSISVAKIAGDPERIALYTQINALAHTTFGKKPTKSVQPLPSLKFTQEHRDDFTLFVLGKLPFDEASEVINAKIAGQKIEHEGYSITLQSARLYGVKGFLKADISFTGDVSGTLKVKGRLGYEPHVSLLTFEKFDFEIETEDSFLAAADWLLHDTVKEEISNRLSVPLLPLVEKLPELVNQGVEKGKAGKKIDLLLDSVSVHPHEILVNPNDLQLLVKATGKSWIELGEL